MIIFFFFFFNDTATTEIYTLSLHDALPILYSVLQALRSLYRGMALFPQGYPAPAVPCGCSLAVVPLGEKSRSEEHTSELQSQSNLVCRLLLEKKKITLVVFSVRNCTEDKAV